MGAEDWDLRRGARAAISLFAHRAFPTARRSFTAPRRLRARARCQRARPAAPGCPRRALMPAPLPRRPSRAPLAKYFTLLYGHAPRSKARAAPRAAAARAVLRSRQRDARGAELCISTARGTPSRKRRPPPPRPGPGPRGTCRAWLRGFTWRTWAVGRAAQRPGNECYAAGGVGDGVLKRGAGQQRAQQRAQQRGARGDAEAYTSSRPISTRVPQRPVSITVTGTRVDVDTLQAPDAFGRHHPSRCGHVCSSRSLPTYTKLNTF